MKTPITLIFISILLIALTCTCEKDDENNIDPLPPNTEIGANTFIFRVNGGEIIESEVGYIPANPRLRVSYNHVDTFRHNDYLFHITGNKILLEHHKSVCLQVNYMPEVGKYKLSEYLPLGKGNYASYTNYEQDYMEFYTNSDNIGELNITKLDTFKHIISGRFKFQAQRYIQYNVTKEEYVTVDGQFDVKYKPNIGVNYY